MPPPPLITPLLVSVAIVPVLALDTPAPPVAGQAAATRRNCRRNARAAGDRAAVGQRLDRAGVGYPGAAAALTKLSPEPLAAPPLIMPAVGERLDRARVGHAGAAGCICSDGVPPRSCGGAARDLAAVGQRRDRGRGGVGHAGAAERIAGGVRARAAPDRAAVGQRRRGVNGDIDGREAGDAARAA